MRSGRFAAALLLGLGACGGGGGSGGSSSTLSRSLASDPVLDGVVYSNGSVYTAGGTPDAGNSGAGDLDDVSSGRRARAFLSFERSSIPVGATIVGAFLHTYQGLVLGTPYANHGDVVADHVDYGTSLGAGDFALGLASPGNPVVSSDPSVGWRHVDVTAFVLADVAAGRPRTQIRLRFDGPETDLDGDMDLAFFDDATGGLIVPPRPPILEIVYVP
jgi:hypothetical protein